MTEPQARPFVSGVLKSQNFHLSWPFRNKNAHTIVPVTGLTFNSRLRPSGPLPTSHPGLAGVHTTACPLFQGFYTCCSLSPAMLFPLPLCTSGFSPSDLSLNLSQAWCSSLLIQALSFHGCCQPGIQPLPPDPLPGLSLSLLSACLFTVWLSHDTVSLLRAASMYVLCPEYSMCSLNILPVAQAKRIQVILESTLVVTPMSDAVANLLGSTFKIYHPRKGAYHPLSLPQSKPPPSDTLKSLLPPLPVSGLASH